MRTWTRREIRWWAGAGAAVVLACGPLTLGAAAIGVNIYPAGYSPAAATINVNDQVRWTWQSDYHTTTSNSGLWDSGLANTGFTYTHTFSSAGNFPYYCTVHLFTGLITV